MKSLNFSLNLLKESFFCPLIGLKTFLPYKNKRIPLYVRVYTPGRRMSSIKTPYGCKLNSMVTTQQIQKNIAKAIKQSGLSQTEIGKRTGISQQSVSHYVKGDKMPSLDTFANLCIALDISPNEILSEKFF